MAIADSDRPTRSEKILTEFSALRREIEQRSNAQLALVTLNLTAVGAIGSFALSKYEYNDLLILLAFICPSIGMLWVDHAFTIENIGDYIRDSLKFQWEDVVADERVIKRHRLLFGAQIFLLFCSPAIASLWKLWVDHHFAVLSLPRLIIDWAWNVSLLLLLWFVISLASYIGEPLWRQWRRRQAKPQALWDLGFSNLQKLRDEKFGFRASEAITGNYNTLFGRDSLWILIFLLKALKAHPSPSQPFRDWVEKAGSDVIRSLCEFQGEADDPTNEEQPGKIIHEYREKLDERLIEMRLGFVRGRLYSGFDQTFLFVSAYRLFSEAFPANHIAAEAWGNVERALGWIDNYASKDRDDGLYGYARRNPHNYPNQIWKDSYDSIAFADKDLPTPPVAWVEVQAYAYRAFLDAAELYRGRKKPGKAAHYSRLAEDIRQRVDDTFWMEKENCFAIALSGEKEQIALVSSNVGHALWAGLVLPERRELMVRRIMQPDMTTRYGLRTLSSGANSYAPFAYHRGCVWPFDNAICAMGLYENGFKKESLRIINGVGKALRIIGKPIELYVVLDTNVFLEPRLRTEQILARRRVDQENQNQGWTAAALLYFAATLAREKDMKLRDTADVELN